MSVYSSCIIVRDRKLFGGTLNPKIWVETFSATTGTCQPLAFSPNISQWEGAGGGIDRNQGKLLRGGGLGSWSTDGWMSRSFSIQKRKGFLLEYQVQNIEGGRRQSVGGRGGAPRRAEGCWMSCEGGVAKDDVVRCPFSKCLSST